MKDKINKVINVVKRDGLKVSSKKIFNYFKVNYLNKINLFAKFDIILNENKYLDMIDKMFLESQKRILVFRSNFGWNVDLYQRPQHMAKSFSKTDTLVLYEVTSFTDKVKTLKKINDNLYLINFNNTGFNRLLESKLQTQKKLKYLDVYSTNWQMTLQTLKKYILKKYQIIYEYIDDLNAQISGTKNIPQNIIDKYNYAVKNDEIFIVTTADVLYNDILEKRGNKNLVLASNGVDYEFFTTFFHYSLEDEYLKILNNGKINICYYGALAKWVDYDLLKAICKTNKYNIILFGIKYDTSLDESQLLKSKNVYFLNSKEYQVLKYYAKKVDILILPFQINSITNATNPLKLFEYMALHKPIVSTNIYEAAKYKAVMIAKNKKDFINKLAQAYLRKDDKKYMELLDKEAKENSWDFKVKIIIDRLNEKEENI